MCTRVLTESCVVCSTEKPIATDLTETIEAINACNEAGVKLMTALQRRFDPNFKRVKQAIVSDEIGEVVTVKLCSRDPAPPPFEYVSMAKVPPAPAAPEGSAPEGARGGLWGLGTRRGRGQAIGRPAAASAARASRLQSRRFRCLWPYRYVQGGGGIFKDMAVHDLDMARYLMDSEPVAIMALGSCQIDPAIKTLEGPEAYDTATVVMKFANGKDAIIDVCRQAPYGYDQRAEVLGKKAMVQTDNTYPNTARLYSASFTGNADMPYDFFMSRCKGAKP